MTGTDARKALAPAIHAGDNADLDQPWTWAANVRALDAADLLDHTTARELISAPGFRG
ncbi:hypothetical protein ABZV91_22980 [Nocardia sp. NPDC004568]|uniref:hypothetical protein n=1 Tax=Nocardia sp. NPDC004568 TaxID=3154551 RepID=UPI0033A75BE6